MELAMTNSCDSRDLMCWILIARRNFLYGTEFPVRGVPIPLELVTVIPQNGRLTRSLVPIVTKEVAFVTKDNNKVPTLAAPASPFWRKRDQTVFPSSRARILAGPCRNQHRRHYVAAWGRERSERGGGSRRENHPYQRGHGSGSQHHLQRGGVNIRSRRFRRRTTRLTLRPPASATKRRALN